MNPQKIDPRKARYTLPVLAVLCLCTAPPAHAIEGEQVRDLEVSRRGDLELTCGQLSEEAALMKEIIATTQDIRDDSRMKENGIGVAGAAASFLVGTLTGGLGIAAAGFLANEAVEDKGQEAENIQDIAEQRRALMTGIYNAKGCQGPIEKDLPETEKAEIDTGGDMLAATEPAAGNKATYNE